MATFRVQHQCPQCGGTIEFSETDHFLICPFCDVRNFMWTPQYFRFVFAPRVAGDEVVYAPYLHFKGNAFFVQRQAIEQKVVEFTRLGLVSRILPGNLGWKTQTQPMSVLHRPGPGRFLRFDLKPSDMLRTAIETVAGGMPPYHTFIGEALSLVYFPLVVKGQALLDGVTGDPVARLPSGFRVTDQELPRAPRSELHFVPALCPSCGWALDGEGRSLAFVCDNCDSAWEPVKGRLQQRPVSTAHTRGGQYVYLPFWTMTATFSHPHIDTFDDFLAFTNQRSPHRSPDGLLRMWTPAFKIQARSMLRLCARPTVAQHPFVSRPDLPRRHRHPVTLSSQEAAQLLPLTLAQLTMNKRSILPALDSVRCHPGAPELVYLPFRKAGADVIQPEINLAVSPNALALARYL